MTIAVPGDWAVKHSTNCPNTTAPGTLLLGVPPVLIQCAAFEYPKTCSTPAADFTEIEFRNRFVSILAEQVARFFYPHDPKDDYGNDALSIR